MEPIQPKTIHLRSEFVQNLGIKKAVKRAIKRALQLSDNEPQIIFGYNGDNTIIVEFSIDPNYSKNGKFRFRLKDEKKSITDVINYQMNTEGREIIILAEDESYIAEEPVSDNFELDLCKKVRYCFEQYQNEIEGGMTSKNFV